MTYFVIDNNVNTQLAAAAASGATTLTLASSANLPTLSAGQVMPLTLNDAATGTFYEIVYVTAISGVTLTVTRAQEGTGALNWNIGDYTFCAPTAGTVATALGNPNNAFQVAPATQSQHAAQLSQVGFQNQAVYARISGVQMVSINGGAFSTTGATSFTVPVSGRCRRRVWGAGGGGGSAFNGASATGGAGGGYAEAVTVATAGTVWTVSVGAAGTGASGSNNGTAGGTTSIGTGFNATGGGGGNGSAAGAASGLSVTPGQGTGGSLNIFGQPVTSAYQFGSTYVGSGGGGTFGSCPSSLSVGAATVAFFPGGGGGGGASNNGGANGADGLAIIEW